MILCDEPGLSPVDIGGMVGASQVVDGDGVLVVLVVGLTHQGDRLARREVPGCAGGLVVVLATELRDVDTDVWEAPVRLLRPLHRAVLHVGPRELRFKRDNLVDQDRPQFVVERESGLVQPFGDCPEHLHR
jgi:hypothetical protein